MLESQALRRGLVEVDGSTARSNSFDADVQYVLEDGVEIAATREFPRGTADGSDELVVGIHRSEVLALARTINRPERSAATVLKRPF